MKIKMPLLSAVIGMLLFTTCTIQPPSKNRDFSSHAPMALVTVVANQDINWLGEITYKSSSYIISDFVRDKLGLNKEGVVTVRTSSSDELIEEADNILRQVINGAGIFNLLEKGKTLRAASYYTAGSFEPKKDSGLIAARGYRFFNEKDKQFAQKYAAETEVKSILYVTFEFNKEMVSGFSKTGKCRSRVLLRAIVVDSTGKRLYKDELTAYSSDRIEVMTGTYSDEELMDLLKEAIGIASYNFVWNFKGIQSGAQINPR